MQNTDAPSPPAREWVRDRRDEFRRVGPKTTKIIWVRAETPYPLDLRLEAGLRPVTPNKSFIQKRRGKVKVHVYVLMQLKFYGTFPKPGCDVILPMPAIAAYA